MLTHRQRDWSAVKESLRRERNIHDLLQRSGTTRLHRRVIVTEMDRTDWCRSERLIVATERSIKALDPSAPDFWIVYRKLEEDLVRLYHKAKVDFQAR